MSKKVHMASATQRSGTINIVYLNTDWKQSRHDTPESRSRNKRKLQETIESIAASMHPDILCMCEVGVASALMTEQQLEEMSEWCVEQWKRTATGRAGAGFRSPEYQSEQAWKAAQENFSLSVLYAKDAPYMTIYNNKKCTCLKNTTLHNVYQPKCKEPRTAQHMLFQTHWNTPSGAPGVQSIRIPEMVEIVNVHAPSGTGVKQLTDANRSQLIFNILQRESLETPATILGHKNFVIGGDMNTAPGTLTELLSQAYSSGQVNEEPTIMPHQMSADIKPGDYCFLQGILAELLPRKNARNHDRQHDPYGIKWRPATRREERRGSAMASSSTMRYEGRTGAVALPEVTVPKQPPPRNSIDGPQQEGPQQELLMPKRLPPRNSSVSVSRYPRPKRGGSPSMYDKVAKSTGCQSPGAKALDAMCTRGQECAAYGHPSPCPLSATSQANEAGKAMLPLRAKARPPKTATPKPPPLPMFCKVCHQNSEIKWRGCSGAEKMVCARCGTEVLMTYHATLVAATPEASLRPKRGRSPSMHDTGCQSPVAGAMDAVCTRRQQCGAYGHPPPCSLSATSQSDEAGKAMLPSKIATPKAPPPMLCKMCKQICGIGYEEIPTCGTDCLMKYHAMLVAATPEVSRCSTLPARGRQPTKEQKSSPRLETMHESAARGFAPGASDPSESDTDRQLLLDCPDPCAAGEMPESMQHDDSCVESCVGDGHDDEPGAANDTHESARDDESCTNSCADRDADESAHDDDSGADDDTHEARHDDDSGADDDTHESKLDDGSGADDDTIESKHDEDRTERDAPAQGVAINRAQELLYNVLNAMLDHVSFRSESAEEVLRNAVDGQEASMQFRSQTKGIFNAIEKIFAPIFYHFGDKKKHQAQQEHWQPVSNSASATYIVNWRHHRKLRETWNPTGHITALQVLEEAEWKNVLEGERDKHSQKYLYHGYLIPTEQQTRSAFCAKLREETGDKRIAFAIWKLGMPEKSTVLDEFTERTEPTTEMRERLAADAAEILSWFYKIAVDCIMQDPNERAETLSAPQSQGRVAERATESNVGQMQQDNAWHTAPQTTNTEQYESGGGRESMASGWSTTWYQHSWQQYSWHEHWQDHSWQEHSWQGAWQGPRAGQSSWQGSRQTWSWHSSPC